MEIEEIEEEMPTITYNKTRLNPAEAGLTGTSTCAEAVAALEARGVVGARLIARGQTASLDSLTVPCC